MMVGKMMLNLTSHKRCRVCDGIASGFNYAGLSCESCKVFFCRNSSKLESFRCDFGDNCEIDMSTRRYCAKCRLVKCFAIGMKKKKKNKSNKSYHLDDQITNRIENFMQISILNDITQFENIKPISDSDYIFDLDLQNKNLGLPLTLNPFEVESITEARNAISIFRYEHTAQIIKRVANAEELAATPLPQNLLYIKKTIEFCQNFQVFNSLPCEDQLEMIKPAYFNITTIWSTFQYDLKQKGFLMFADESETYSLFIGNEIIFEKFGKYKEKFEQMLQHSIQLYDALENDVNIRDLTSALVLFKTERYLSCPENIRYHYHLYCSILQRYLLHKYRSKAEANKRYLFLMNLLDQLEFYYEEIRKILQFKAEKIPSIFRELYDLV